MRAIIDTVGADELARVQHLLPFVKGVWRKTKNDELEYQFTCRLIEEFLRTYMHKDEHRQTNFFCRMAYQQLLNSGIFKEMEAYEDCQAKS